MANRPPNAQDIANKNQARNHLDQQDYDGEARARQQHARPGQIVVRIDQDLTGNRALHDGIRDALAPIWRGRRALPAKSLIL